jgi:hypothetical protein
VSGSVSQRHEPFITKRSDAGDGMVVGRVGSSGNGRKHPGPSEGMPPASATFLLPHDVSTAVDAELVVAIKASDLPEHFKARILELIGVASTENDDQR